MEEEGGDDSEMIDAMDGWDSDQDDGNTAASGNTNGGSASDAGSSAQAAAGGKGVDAS